MKESSNNLIARRRFLRASAAVSSAALLAACSERLTGPPAQVTRAPATPAGEAPTAAATGGAPATTAPAPAATGAPAGIAPATVVPEAQLQPTPPCDDDDDITPPAAEGPFYTPNSPQRASLLEPGMAGTRMILTGRVMTTACVPVAGALVDLWHADDAGIYDNEGFRLRGHQFADTDGRYRFETILPGLYPGRTRHFHVKVQAMGGPVLTTQLYFPDEAGNNRDRLFNPALLLDTRQDAGVLTATFDFVLNAG